MTITLTLSAISFVHNITLQKQINHRVVTQVADKLKRQWSCIMYFANCIRQPERKLPSHPQPHLVDIVTTDHAPFEGACIYITIILQI